MLGDTSSFQSHDIIKLLETTSSSFPSHLELGVPSPIRCPANCHLFGEHREIANSPARRFAGRDGHQSRVRSRVACRARRHRSTALVGGQSHLGIALTSQSIPYRGAYLDPLDHWLRRMI